jgi:hypothetical protein
MLADDLIAAVGSPFDAAYCGAFGELAKRLRTAQRFDLSPEVMRSAFTVAHSPIGGQLRALSLCKLPFRQAWFEWPGGYAGTPSERTDIIAPVPKRMGALVETDESLQRGTIVYAWRHDDGAGGANICPLAVTFDWRATGAEPLDDLTSASRWHLRATDADWRDLAEKFPRVRNSAREDVVADNYRFGVVLNPMMQTFLDVAAQGAFDLLLNAASKDIEGEPTLLRAAVMLLNSRNLAEYQPRPIAAKLNHARKKNGKPALLDYTHVRIRLSRALGERAGMAADPRAPSRLHLVRGHFKVRATGVYWWAPFARGTPASSGGKPLQQTRHVAT